MMQLVITLLTAFLMISGSLFALVAAIGINRFPDLYTRMHAASKAGTIGSGLLLLAVGIHSVDISILARTVAGFFFFVLTAPISAHLLARAAHLAGYKLCEQSVVDEFKITHS